MAHYVKTFDRIFQSTIWQEDSDTRIVWWTLLLLADQDGRVHSTVPGLAHTARVSMESCVKALERFRSPDKYSSTKEFEGRRVQDAEGGFQILNYEKYRDMMSEDDRREKARLRQQRKRERDRSRINGDSHAVSPSVTPRTACNDTRLEETRLEEKKGEEPPPDLHPTNYAARLLEELALTHTKLNLLSAAAAIELEIKQGKSGPAAYEFILARARDARESGTKVDRFYFEDWGNHRNGISKKPNAMEEFKRRRGDK